MTQEEPVPSGPPAALTAAERAALSALAGLFIITVAWWALALWPPPAAPPPWLIRARAVCFNAGPSGLPDASGWMLLVGQPLGMFAVLMVFAGDAVRGVLSRLRSTTPGRGALAAVGLVLFVGVVTSGVRVYTAQAGTRFVLPGDFPAPTYPRVDREAPPFELVDQEGVPTGLERFRGSPVLVTFAFGHCEAICPLVVHETLRAQRTLRAEGRDVAMVVVSLDPWRDTPRRLPHLVAQWGLGPEGFVLSGDPDQVNAMLDAWNVARSRDPLTGDIVHPPLVFVVDQNGRIAYAVSGGALAIQELVSRL